MKKNGSQGKARIAPVGAAAVLGMTGMGLVSGGVVAADTASVVDTISVTVQSNCTFKNVEDKTYIGSAANGTEVGNFNDSGVHEFNLFCNDNNGFIVTATPYDLEASGIEDVIAYTDNYNPSGVNSIWSAAIASEATGVTVVPVVPIGGGTILSSDTSTAAEGVDFSATYSAYVGTATTAGTYTGRIEYTLTASGTSSNIDNGNNGGNENSGGNENDNNGGNSGTNSGNEVTENTNNNSGNSGSGTNGTKNASPLAMNSTYNTYNTTNYSGGSAGTPVAVNGSTNGAAGEGSDSEGDAEAGNSYEKPLGVTTGATDATDTTGASSSSEDSSVDWMPMVAVGAALAVAGVAAVAMSKSEKDEE